jgi:hypothetical protein
MEDKAMYYGIYSGTCFDNVDPENTNRIMLLCPQVLGPNVPSRWAPPLIPVTSNGTHDNHTETYTTSSVSDGGYEASAHTHTVTLDSSHSAHITIPDINQSVWVMFEGGDSNFPIWVGVA